MSKANTETGTIKYADWPITNMNILGYFEMNFRKRLPSWHYNYMEAPRKDNRHSFWSILRKIYLLAREKNCISPIWNSLLHLLHNFFFMKYNYFLSLGALYLFTLRLNGFGSTYDDNFTRACQLVWFLLPFFSCYFHTLCFLQIFGGSIGNAFNSIKIE